MLNERSLLTATEEELKQRFEKKVADKRRLPSVAADAPASERIDQLVLPDDMRAKMPVTKDKYLVRENPHLVQWERECRKFLRRLVAGPRTSGRGGDGLRVGHRRYRSRT